MISQSQAGGPFNNTITDWNVNQISQWLGQLFLLSSAVDNDDDGTNVKNPKVSSPAVLWLLLFQTHTELVSARGSIPQFTTYLKL